MKKQSKKDIAIQASLRRRFRVGQDVTWLTNPNGSVELKYFAHGKVTEVEMKNPKDDEPFQYVTARMDEKSIEDTGKLGMSASSGSFFDRAESKGKSFHVLKNSYIIDAEVLKTKKAKMEELKQLKARQK